MMPAAPFVGDVTQSFGARRVTDRRPGNTPSVRRPRSMHEHIAAQIPSRPSLTAVSPCHVVSLRNTSSAMLRLLSAAIFSNDSLVEKVNGGSPVREPGSGSSPRATKPPPSEYQSSSTISAPPSSNAAKRMPFVWRSSSRS